MQAELKSIDSDVLQGFVYVREENQLTCNNMITTRHGRMQTWFAHTAHVLPRIIPPIQAVFAHP